MIQRREKEHRQAVRTAARPNGPARLKAAVALPMVFALCTSAFADIIVDHQPHPYGGFGSDTLFVSSLGQTVWQRIADDFTLGQPATIASFGAWGFYDHDVAPTAELMRIRFYAARPGDGLPDDANILYEEYLSNPSRIATGRHIFDDYFPREFFYQSDLASTVTFDAGRKYWFEFVQIGDISTHFRWEDSTAELNDSAGINSYYPYWSYAGGSAVDEAFQLRSIPVPSSLSLLVFGVTLATLTRTGGERSRPCNKQA